MAKLHRRNWLKTAASIGVGTGLAGSWVRNLSANLRAQAPDRHFIVLWMPGGPSQLDTFDMKPGQTNGGPLKETSTATPGIRFSEHLPQLAKLSDKLAIIRSLQTKEGDHSRGTYFVRTGQRPGSPVRYPAFPAAVAKELTADKPLTPDYVSILPFSAISPPAFGSGFLGPRYQPFTVGSTAAFSPTPPDANMATKLEVDYLKPPTDWSLEQLKRRHEFWEMLQETYDADNASEAIQTHSNVYRQAMQLADSPLAEAFDLDNESQAIRDRYGSSRFGQGCLMARRLIEQGVPVVEVSLTSGGGLDWDTHADNFAAVKRLCGDLDQGWSQLMMDLDSSGLLEKTTILWIGEFGRTPEINSNGGRDHFPNAWSCVLAGGGVAGGQVYGSTTENGMDVADNPVGIPEVLATCAAAAGITADAENISEEGRPIKMVEAQPIIDLLS